MPKPRQAIVVIHGIGEQRPLETLRGFVLGVLGRTRRDDGVRTFYSKPDPNDETFELRRYRAFEKQADTDFIEFYWQHKMPVAAWRFLLSWLWRLMKRPVEAMPPRFVILWWVAWAAALLFALAVIASVLAWLGLPVPAAPVVEKLPWGVAVIVGALGFLVRAFAGDAAIYLNPHPRTVEARNAIRAGGVALLERLHSDGRYNRIVVVGHSLGSVIGYDVLSFAWHRASEGFRRRVEAGLLPQDKPAQPALAAAEALAAGGDVTPVQWHAAVRALSAEMYPLKLGWLVTDFLTLGSPLAHGSLLLASGPGDLQRRMGERELPKSPPVLEDGRHFSYERTGRSPGGAAQAARVPDHAALFALTAWSNFYFPCRTFFHGDLVGGPVAPFGSGIRDEAVTTRVRGGWLAHTHYWTRYRGDAGDPHSAPRRLVEALDLFRETFPKSVRKKRTPITPARAAKGAPARKTRS